MALSGKGSLQVRSSEGCQTDHPRVWGGLKSNDWCPTETPRDAGAETGVTRPQARAHLPPPTPGSWNRQGRPSPGPPREPGPSPTLTLNETVKEQICVVLRPRFVVICYVAPGP